MKISNFEGNLKQGHAAINTVTKVGPSLNTYRDIKVEFSSTGNVEREKEITLSLKSNISDLISLLPKTKHDLTRITSLIRSQGEKEVSITYSKAIAFDNIKKFFLEENIFELSLKNLLLSLNSNNSINLDTLSLKV